jgi:hypothetical protein
MHLTRRILNRTLLQRQMLLARQEVSPLAAIEHLVGLQAQQARPPFIGLWSRLVGFQAQDLRALIRNQAVVRASLMRCTLHLMSRADFIAFRQVLQPALTGALRSALGPWSAGEELETLLAEGRRILSERPRSFAEVRGLLGERFPDADAHSMGLALRVFLPLAIIPREHEWGYRADSQFALADEWLGEPLWSAPDPSALVLRYLAAFGPASVQDMSAWSGLSGLRAKVEALRPRLTVHRDEENRELFDLPDVLVASEDTPAPARLVADFDNLILSHADRRRVISDEHRKVVITKNGMVLPTILVDGFVAGTWSVARVKDTVTVALSPFTALDRPVLDELEAEAESLAAALFPDAARQVLQLP